MRVPLAVAVFPRGLRMDQQAKIEDLKLAVEMSQGAVRRHRQRVSSLVEIEACGATIAMAKLRLQAVEEIHAEDLAELQRLTTN